ncbi:MAG: hypothetical protein OHK0028_08420 [Deltaproteobacteria bacterium]
MIVIRSILTVSVSIVLSIVIAPRALSGETLPGSLPADLRREVRSFGAIPGDGVEDSTSIQRAIDNAAAEGGGDVLIPPGVFDVANLQLKSNVRIVCSKGAVLKLVDDAISASHNGAPVDDWGHYAANVISTTLRYDGVYSGGTMFDGGARAKDPANSLYIVENAAVVGCDIDGNVAKNASHMLEDMPGNGAAAGHGISLAQATRVVIAGNTIHDTRLDGINIGYTLHGGSDFNRIEGNFLYNTGRSGIQQVTGKQNVISGNTIVMKSPVSAGIDVEANWDDEINYRHSITGNVLVGTTGIGLGSVAANANQGGLSVTGNTIEGQIWLGTARQIGGSTISGNTFIARNPADNWIHLNAHVTTGSTACDDIRISGNTATGYDFVVERGLAGISSLVLDGNSISSRSGVYLSRPYRVAITNNRFRFAGGDNTASAIHLLFGEAGAVPRQGEVLIKGNEFHGSGLKDFVESRYSADPPAISASDVRIENNHVHLSLDSAANADFALLDSDSSWHGNDLVGVRRSIRFSGNVGGFLFRDNRVAGSFSGDFFDARARFQNAFIEGNFFDGVDVSMVRPHNCSVSRNTIRNARLAVTYHFTEGKVGNNVFSGNNIVSDGSTTVSHPILFQAGPAYRESDFTGKDEVYGNTFVGKFTNPVQLLPTRNDR